MTHHIHSENCSAASGKLRIRRTLAGVSIVALVMAAIGLPVIAPQPAPGTHSVLAIARADCPPDCGGGPGNGGTPTGPPGGGTEFIPPSMPALPSANPNSGQPPLDQNNGVSIYNSQAPQPSQAAQPTQAPTQNQDGSYTRASNGEQQPINYNNAPNNQQINSDWQKLSDQLNQQQNQPALNNEQPDQSLNQQNDTQTCSSILGSLGVDAISLNPPPGAGAITLKPPSSSTPAVRVGLSQEAIDVLAHAGLTPQYCPLSVTQVEAVSPDNSILGGTPADSLIDSTSPDNPDGLENSVMLGCVSTAITKGGPAALAASEGGPGAMFVAGAGAGAEGCVFGGMAGGAVYLVRWALR